MIAHVDRCRCTHLEAGDQWCSPGHSVEPVLFNVFINGLDKGTECTLNQCAEDTKVGWGAVDLLEGQESSRGIWSGWFGGPRPAVWGSTQRRARSCPWVPKSQMQCCSRSTIQSPSLCFAREQQRTSLMLLCHQLTSIEPQSSHSSFLFVAFI